MRQNLKFYRKNLYGKVVGNQNIYNFCINTFTHNRKIYVKN